MYRRIPGVKFTVAGIDVPPSTPLDWLYVHMRHPDLFLYVVISKDWTGIP